MARFFDQTNIMEFFESPVREEPFPLSSAHMILKVHSGRLKASKYFFRLPEARKDRKLWESLKTISTTYRNYLCQKLIVEKLKKELEIAVMKTAEIGRNLDDLISQASMSYTSIENPQIRPDMVINSSGLSQENRDQVALNCKL